MKQENKEEVEQKCKLISILKSLVDKEKRKEE